jgi:hypothetical protein
VSVSAVVALSVCALGAVTVSPWPGWVTVIAMVAVPVSGVTGWTTILAAAPGPVIGLQVTVTGLVTVSKLAACMVPAPRVSAARAANLPLRILMSEIFINDLSSWNFSATMRRGVRVKLDVGHIAKAAGSSRKYFCDAPRLRAKCFSSVE